MAQQRADRLRIFRDELAELERQQILTVTPEQRARLDPFLDQTLADLARTFDVDVTESQRKLSLGMRLVSALGGLALCAAIVLFFIRFWGMIPTAGQVAILIATPLLGLIGMEFTSRVERTLYFTSLIGIVTFAAFVLNLAALGGIFNVTSSPNAFLAWGLLALILAYLYGLRLPMAAALVCFLVFFSGTILSWAGAWWTEFPQRPETVLLGGSLSLVVAVLLPHRQLKQFPQVYALVGLLAAYGALLILWHSGDSSFLQLDRIWIERGYQLLAFATAAGTIWIGIRHNLSGIINLGSVAFTIFLYIKFVDWWWDWMPKYLFFFIVGAIAIGLLLAFRRLREAIA